MKKIVFILLASFLCLANAGFSQIYFSAEASKKITGAECIAYENGRDLPVYIKLRQGYEVNYSDWQQWVFKILKLNPEMGFSFSSVQKDKEGDLHYRFIQTYDNVKIEGTTLIVHTKNGKVYSFNGNIISSVDLSGNPGLTESDALASALSYMNASKYRWEVPAEEALLKYTTNDPDATYYPKGELFYSLDKSSTVQSYKLTYRFDIYADVPLKRSYVFVDAQDGKILLDLNRIQTTDVPGTAVTRYSGTVDIMTDSISATSFRLRETTRGLGVETYNMQTGTNYGSAVDFTDSDNYWDNANTAMDEIAGDAHWGAEMTYDYYYNTFGRNSVDDAGYKLISYVHYDVGYDNAYWDGTCMTYGDGDGSSYTPFTALDVCGHEITHGVQTFTCNFNYQDEPGALAEGYSDIFGCSVEFYAKPATANWDMGEDISSTPLRSLATPKLYQCPNTYLGNFWATGTADNGGVHTNCGVIGYWYYLMAAGGSGTNDNAISYNITGMGIDTAAAIAYRTMAVYLTSTSGYADARFYSILSAIDLYGPCTQAVATVADAWYACGVGGPYDSTVVADFSASFNTFCSFPATVQFTNNSSNANVFTWDFGDGTTSTAMNPNHVYTSYGNFTVQLISSGGSCGTDTLTIPAYISVDALNPCNIIMPQTGIADTQTSCSGVLFDSGGSGNYQDGTNSTITIQPVGASTITLNFTTFAFENTFDYLRIYDGPSTTSPLIGSYTGYNLPNGGTITSSYGAVTFVQTSDVAVNDTGFVCSWLCNMPTTPPQTNFEVNDTLSCTGDVQFMDMTTNGPLTWFWDFGDGDTSIVQYPQHTYIYDGSYTVSLITSNAFGSDTLEKPLYVVVDKPEDPIADSAWRCDPGSVTLTAIGSSNLNWYDAPTGGNLLYTGSTFVTPFLDSTTVFYVQDVVPAPSQYVGPIDNTIGNGSYSTSSFQRFLIFDCYVPVKLASVYIYSDSSFIRTITLTDATGTLLMDTAVLVPSGETRVYLNFNIPAGTGYELGTAGGSHFYRNQNGASFPYDIPGIISITGTNSSSTTTYYYFYNWEIQGGQCESNRIPALAEIYLPAPDIAPSGTVDICDGQSVTLTCETAESYLWWPGNETTQSIIVDQAGQYTVMVTDSICSSVSDTVTVIVTTVLPTAGFTFSANIGDVTFTNTSTDANSYTWDFGDGTSSQLQDPTHTYANNGTYTVMLIAENVCGTDTFYTDITIMGVGITENSDAHGIVIYPNPSNGILHLSVSDLNSISILYYSVYDMIGNVVKTGSFNTANNRVQAIMNMEGAAKGVYFIRLYNESINLAGKFLID
jgi:Zn-dependent metalloprotease